MVSGSPSPSTTLKAFVEDQRIPDHLKSGIIRSILETCAYKGLMVPKVVEIKGLFGPSVTRVRMPVPTSGLEQQIVALCLIINELSGTVGNRDLVYALTDKFCAHDNLSPTDLLGFTVGSVPAEMVSSLFE